MIKYCLLLVWALVAHASVLGIDFGTEFIKASLISPGKSFTIVENLTTKRKTENAVRHTTILDRLLQQGTRLRNRCRRQKVEVTQKHLHLPQQVSRRTLLRPSRRRNFQALIRGFPVRRGRGTSPLPNSRGMAASPSSLTASPSTTAKPSPSKSKSSSA